MEIRIVEQYKTVRGWSGRRYRVRMTNAEIEARRLLGLVGGIVIGVPAWFIAMALAAGLI